ncbi:MAG TPA: histidinol-phosphate transaminase [Pyrinomonadaceae bacterium]|nr:histidinol-phosphate transaminase [Pyrinomonadaceae bacterium]
MSRPLNIIKPSVRELRPYSLRAERAEVKLNQNENPWNTPREIREETVRRMSSQTWSRYPAFVPEQLHKTIARFAGWRADGVIAGNGSNELIQALLMVTVTANTRVLLCEPTFALYRQIVTILGGEVITVPLTSQLRYDTEAIRSRIESTSPQVVIICSPNNPTGCLFRQPDLASLLLTFDGLVVVDEAYQEFSGHTSLPLLPQHSNLVVLRTFSKALALAGLRVGYLLAAPELVREVSKAVLPYNLNIFSQTAAQVAVEMFESKLRPLIRVICEERERLYSGLKTIPGFEPISSRANFMVVRSLMKPCEIVTKLLARGVLVRDVSRYPMLNDYFRVSVGMPVENDILLNALREISKECFE